MPFIMFVLTMHCLNFPVFFQQTFQLLETFIVLDNCSILHITRTFTCRPTHMTEKRIVGNFFQKRYIISKLLLQ